MTNFWGMGHRMTKMNTTFSIENGVPNTILKFFPQKSLYRLNKNQKTSFGAHSDSIGPIASKNNGFHLCVDPQQPCEFHENLFKTATCIVT